MPDVNWMAVLLCARPWKRAAGLPEEQAASGNLAMIFGLSFLLSLIAAFVFAMFLGREFGLGPAIAAGASAGLCWVAASFGIHYVFERRQLRLWLIHGGYHALQFTLFGLILGLMP